MLSYTWGWCYDRLDAESLHFVGEPHPQFHDRYPPGPQNKVQFNSGYFEVGGTELREQKKDVQEMQ